MNYLHDILILVNEYEKISDEAEKAYEADPMNEDKEKAFDESYKKYHYYHTELVKGIVRESVGLIDAPTARKMIATKRNELNELFEKLV